LGIGDQGLQWRLVACGRSGSAAGHEDRSLPPSTVPSAVSEAQAQMVELTELTTALWLP
jgi:hypothetical protein